MKKRVMLGVLLLMLMGSLALPFFSIYPHKDLPQDVAAAFPGSATGLALVFKGNSLLPLLQMPALSTLHFREGLLAAGILFALLGGLLAFARRRWISRGAAIIGTAGSLLLFQYALYAQQLDQSILFDVMLSAKWFAWLPFVFSLFLAALEMWMLQGMPALSIPGMGWRRWSVLLGTIAVLALFLPFAGTFVEKGTFSSPAEDRLASRSLTGWKWLIDEEPMLRELAAGSSSFSDVTDSGTMQALTKLSGSTKDIGNLFMITTRAGGMKVISLAAYALLLVGIALQLIKRVDKWFPACLTTLAAFLLLTEAAGALLVSSQYQFQSATYQLMFMGLGGYTPAPLFSAFAACLSASCATIGIRQANEPYFVNPIPKKRRLLFLSFFLAAAAFLMMLAPVVQVNLYTPGRINQENPTVSRALSGAELAVFYPAPEELQNPVSNRGKALYTMEAANNGRTLSDLQVLVRSALNKLGGFHLASVLVMAFGLFLLMSGKKNKRLIISILLWGGSLQGITVMMALTALPGDVGHVTALAPLFAAMGATAFSAFFAGFLDREELPKKYKLFLMLLPFLIAVLLFAYLPLSGWRYAFYNYKLGLPMNQQEYVGFKWFAALVSSPAQQAETVRVMRNTFAMSGIGIAMSWLPLAFAIFLTEIRVGWFKKFVQIFTTLPNFISWVLVFSFALTIFSLDTGIVNRLLLQWNIIKEPIAYLNSGQQMWIKMWLWSTWKGLGWGAIMYLAAIAGIDQELYEAARVDGAGRWRQIFHITIPGILPTFFVLLLLSISNVVNNGMEQYLVFQNAMNKSTIEVLDLYVFNISIGNRSSSTISPATAIGILKSMISIMLLFMANSFSKLVRGESIV